MAGDLMAVASTPIYRLRLRPDGHLAREAILFAGVGQALLDVTAQGDDEAFPGTIWVGDVATGSLTVFDPAPTGTSPSD